MSKYNSYLCLTCLYLTSKTYTGHYERSESGYRKWIQTTTWYTCKTTNKNIGILKQRCPSYLGIGQTTIKGEVIKRMKLDNIPEEEPRFDLKTLPQKVELKATGEAMQEAKLGRTGGLVITYQMRDGQTFPQKYSAIHGAELKKALAKLKLKDTDELQKAWYEYELIPFRMGFPRMIPTKKM